MDQEVRHDFTNASIDFSQVTFKDEPGEGSGVARSFYTAIAEAIQSEEKLPNLESCLVGAKYGSQFNVLQRLRLRDDYNIRRGQQVRIVKVQFQNLYHTNTASLTHCILLQFMCYFV